MVAPLGRSGRPPIQTPKPETAAPPQPAVNAEAQELVALLQQLGKQLETAWSAATREPGGDPLVKFLRAFTGGDANAPAAQQENQTKLADRQAEAKDGLGFQVSEPEPPAEAVPEGEAGEAVQPSASFAETRARIAEAKADFQATKAEAGALLHSLSKELKLAKEAGQTPEQISATVQQLFGEFRIGTALAPDLVAIGDALGAQITAIGLTGDSPAAYEALALSLLDGKPPPPAKPPPEVEPRPTVAEAIADFEARGGRGSGGGIPVGDIGIAGQPTFPRPTETEEPVQPATPPTQPVVTPGDDGLKLRQDRQRLERRRQEDERKRGTNGGGGGGGDTQRVVEDQLKVNTLNDNLNRQNLERDQLNRRIEDDQLNRRRNR